MAEIMDINDHMARACECGCVRFNLLKSGNVECSSCGLVVDGIYWNQMMERSDKQFESKNDDCRP